MGRVWVGADPGGEGSFGMAFIDAQGGIDCNTVSSVDDAVKFIAAKKVEPYGLGIDAPMWWSSRKGGGRKVDEKLRRAYGIPSGTVQQPNSLRGAALIGGAMLAFRIRNKYPEIHITESHPKALLRAFDSKNSEELQEARICILEALDLCAKDVLNEFPTSGKRFRNDHERDAIIAAVCAREGFSSSWSTDLACDRYCKEQSPGQYWLKPMHYFWPESLD